MSLTYWKFTESTLPDSLKLSPQICPKTSQHLVRVTSTRQQPFYFNQLPKRLEEFDDDNAGSQMNLCVRANLFRTLLLRILFWPQGWSILWQKKNVFWGFYFECLGLPTFLWVGKNKWKNIHSGSNQALLSSYTLFVLFWYNHQSRKCLPHSLS